MKTNKSFSKRIKVTKNGKLITRRPGQNHFNAKETRRAQMAKVAHFITYYEQQES